MKTINTIFNNTYQNSLSKLFKNTVMKNEKYIANGKTFYTYDEVVNYAASLELRITNTETIRKGVYLISLNK